MKEVQRIVDELRFILQREVIEQSDELTNLTAEYSQFCHEANDRLRQCDEYVKQGLRSEALHLAEAAPNLLDLVALLDFAERDELIQLLELYFLTPPEPLLMDVATALNEAYAEHAPLQKLLDSHRLLALGRAPLSQRLTVLRSLAALDAESPHWDDDIRDMERARFSELNAESLAAARSGNTAQLKSLLAEIQADGWREPVPASLSQELKSRSNQTVRSNARQRMETLRDELYAAFSAMDADAARPLRDEWEQKRQILKLDDDDQDCQYVQPVLDWLKDEDQKRSDERAFSKVVADIERLLDADDTTAADLKQVKLAADRFDRSLPTILETRFWSRLETIETIEVRRRKLILGSGIGTVVAAAGLFGFIVYLSMEGAKTRRLIAAATELIDDGKLSDAQKLIEQNAAHATSDEWLAIKRKLSDAEQAERDRVAKWNAEIATVKSSTDSVLIEAALKQARELSKSAEEKIEVGQLQSSWQRRVNEALSAREKTFREIIASASKSLQALDAIVGSSDALESDRIQPMLVGAELQLAQLIPLRDSVSKELSSQGALLESRLKATRQTISEVHRKAELFEKLTHAALLLPGTPQAAEGQGRYDEMLRDFASSFPNDPRAETMKSAAVTSPLPAVMAKQTLTERWKQSRLANNKDVETRVREVRSFFTEHAQSPDREVLAQYETWLASILRRFTDDGDPDEGVHHRMHSLFNSRFIKDAQTLQDFDGNIYYITKETVIPINGSVGADYYVGFNGERTHKAFKSNELVNLKSVSPPQQEIAEKVRSTIRSLKVEGWRDYFRDLIERLLKNEKMDPFLKYLLVLKAVEFAGRGDSLLETELVPVLAKLNDDEIDRSVPWMDPNSKTAGPARTRAKKLLAELPPLEPYFLNAATRQDELERDLFAIRFGVGWLEKKPTGDWACRTKWSPQGKHVLYVVTRPDTSGMRTWSVLGHAHGQSLTVDPAVARTAGEAAIIFASDAVDEAKTALLP